jgi:putative membrane protein
MVVGFGASVVTVSHVLDLHPMLVWGVVFGLVAGAVIFTGVSSKVRVLMIFAPVGLAFALLLNLLPGRETEASLILVFAGAVLAFGAWILPGISGSFVLLVLGVWTTMVHAFADVDLIVILVFLAGLKTGFLVFSHPMRVLLEKYRDSLMAVFCGLLAGSLWRVWPWNSTHVGETSVLAVVLVMCSAFLVICVLTYAKKRKQT